jgi:hypothetical protein
MNQLKKVQVSGGMAAVGMYDVNIALLFICFGGLTRLRQGLAGLTNGILRDNRAFHIDDQQWISKYNDQGLYSCLRT